MKRIFTHLFVAVLMMLSATSWAQTVSIEAGKVYNFKSVGYAGMSMAAVGLEKTAIDDTDLKDYTQLWYVGEGSVVGTYTLRNLGNGLYLQGAGSGTKWPFVEQPSNLYYKTAGSGLSLTANSGLALTSQYWMHYGAGNFCIVGWDANAGASQWIVEEVAISAQALQANWTEVELLNGTTGRVAEYQVLLDNLFSDKSCTVPKKSLNSVSAIENDADYQALPAGLQAMVKKVYLGGDYWIESNIIPSKESWSGKHAKRFRVQLYEPYSYGERTNSMLGIYAHSNMNNPTGLVTNQRDLLYVMVEGEIKEGASLYLQSLVGDDRIGNVGGVELKSGLNIIPYWSDGNQLFIQYVVNTYENGAKTGYKLSQYAPLKIHIEGGCINGCFDTVGDELNPADTDEDWDAYEDRAHQYNFTVLGKYVMWHMPLVIDDSDPGYYDLSECLGTNATSVKVAMNAWETIESAQRLMEGLLSEQEINSIPNASRVFDYTGNDPYERYPSDYSEEYNNRSMAYSTKDGYFMFAADWSTHYASNTLDDVILNIATAGDPWGPSHEIGHTYQGPINLPSTSETSNNAIANVSNWFLGRTSSRLGSTQSLLEQYNNNTSFLGTDINSGNVWEKLMMYTKLWFYYHVTGHNKTFYPRLFEMLRRDPIARDKGVALSGNETMLKFYKYACMAAEEDLTDFFEVFGFFVPVDGTLSDDYGDFKTVMTQAEIDAAKAEVAAMAAEKGWKKNSAIIFIDDRIGTVYSHDGQTVLAPRGDGGKEQGVLGSINDFDSNPNNDVAPLTGEYSYTVSGNTITMQGATGGVGFLIYDADGNLVSFSNTYSFPLGEKAQVALASGTARVVVTTADINAQPIEIHDANSTQTQAELLAGLLLDVEELLRCKDESGTKVGYYKSSALAALENAYTAASEVYNNKDLASYGGVYSVLYEEYNAVTTSPTAKIEFVDGRTYYLKNVESGRYMTVDGNNVMATATAPTASATASLWQINAGFYETFYSIKNQSTGTYIRQPQKEGDNYNDSQQFVMTSDPHTFIFEEVSTGKFAIKDRGSKKYLNYHESGSKIATWGGNNTGSQWEIVYLPVDEIMTQRTALEDLMLSAQLLIDGVGNSKVVYEGLPLQVNTSNAKYYLYTNAQDPDEGDIEYLVDNETGDTGDKFFHSDWHSVARPAGYHYLEVDLGDDNTDSIFKFAYTNRNNGSNHPDGIAVKVSNKKDDYQNGTVVYEVLSGLPQGQGQSWTSDVFETGGTYRYLHFKITADNTFWHMDEFDIYTPKVSVELFDKYSSIDEKFVSDVINVMIKDTILLSKDDLTREHLEEAYGALSQVYNNLLNAKTSVDNSALNAEKERLSVLVSSATSLIDECKVGEIVSSPASEVAVDMQGTDPNAVNYLYCNALNNKIAGNNNGDNCMNTAKLLDNNTDTYLHTIPDGQDPDDNLDHYLRVDFGDNAQNGMLKFAYHTRKVSSYSVFPEIIKIEGSDSPNGEYEEIATISSGLPNKQDTYYESAVFGNGTNYRYVRFMVTDTHADRTTSNNATYGQHKYFCLAEFDLWVATVDYLDVTLSDNCGMATETMVLDAYRAVQAAQKALAMATTAQQLQAAYTVLDKAYTTLQEAKSVVTVNTAELQSLYDTALELYGKMTDDEGNLAVYYSTSPLAENGMLATVKSAIENAQEALRSATEQADVDAAKEVLQEAYNALLSVENADLAADNRTGLTDLIAITGALIGEVAVVSDETVDAVKISYASAITLERVQEVHNAMKAAENAATCYMTADDYSKILDGLQAAYNELSSKKETVDANRNDLQVLVDETNALIAQAGEATIVAAGEVDLRGKLYAERPYTAGGTNHSDYSSAENNYNLLDGRVDTHFHSDYNYSTMVSPPYIRVDLGEGEAVRKFKFNYTTRNANGCAPTKIKVYGGVPEYQDVKADAAVSSDYLNTVTKATRIVVKNVSGTNSAFFAANANTSDWQNAVLVWEPVEDGVAGKYYLRTTDAEGGYIQKGSAAVRLGSRDNAQVFYTTAPSTDIPESQDDKLHFTGESLVNGTDMDNLVRFVQEGGTTWLNCQKNDNAPVLGNNGNGGWTVHNVYLVNEEAVPSFNETPVAIFTSSDATNALPTTSSTSWTSGEIECATAYRYFKFEVEESQGSKTENGVKKYYFVMSEFGFNKLDDELAIVNPEYAGRVGEQLLIDTRRAVNAAESMLGNTAVAGSVEEQIGLLTDAKAALHRAMSVDLRDLQGLYDIVLPVYEQLVDADGNMKAEYEAVLTDELLSGVKSAIETAADALESAQNQGDVDTAFTTLQTAYGAMDNKARTILNNLVSDAQELYSSLATDEDNVKEYYSTSGLTVEMLVDAKEAMTSAQSVGNDETLAVVDINEAYVRLKQQYDELNGIKLADCADRTALTTAISNANTLLAAIAAKGEGYYSTVTGLGLDELRTALDGALEVVDKYHTTAECASLLERLNTCYNATLAVVDADCNSENRNNLSTLIGNVNTLLATIADADENTYAISLQATDENGNYYIKLSAVGDGSVANMIDKDSDGGANTDTYVGSAWGDGIADYTHYVQVDLGKFRAIDALMFDYTTRNSGHNTERPTAIKVLGSNNGTDFAEVTIIAEGLATGAGEKSALLSVELGNYYRYVRFAVKSGVNSFHMSDFNLYTKLSHTLKEYYTTAEGLDFIALCLALDEASDAAAHYMTTEQYTIVYNKLNGCYTTADGVVDNDYKGDRDAFATLRTETETLVNDVVAIDETETVIALQATDANAPYYIYCNAPGATNNYGGDNLGVAALLDVEEGGEPITATFLHTSYVAGSHDDDLDHYLRVDMGESNLLSFKFRYTPRIGNTDNAPLVMLIEGSNDCENFEEITTLTDMATTYQSGEITNGKAYRYIRFMVKDTHNHSEHDGHKFFAMSHFEMTACETVTISQESASPNLSVDVAANAYNELVDANALDTEHYLPNEVGVAAQAELQAAYDALYAAEQMKNIPVKLTTDANNPVLYKIYINRAFNNSAVDLLAYDGASQVDVADLDFESTVQNWYFMQGTDENSYGDVLILPASAGGKALATNSFSEGTGKVSAQETDTEGYSYNWEINQIADKEWYNIKMNNGSDTYYYFSNHSGSGYKMGFYNSSTSTDGGSMFRFVLADAYSVLKDCYDPLEKEPEVYAPGYFSNAEQYNTAYDVASEYVNCANGTEEQYIEAYNELFAQKKALTTRTPSHVLEDGAVYRIMNLITNTETQYKYHYIANNNAAISFPTTPAEDNNSDLWVCKANEDGTYEFVSALGTATLGWDYTIIETNTGAVKENATKFVVDDGTSESGAKRIAESNYSMSLTNELWNSKGEALFNRAGNDGKAQSDNWSTDWYFQKVEDADVAFNVNISSRRFSSLYLPYNVTVPAGVSAFTAVAVDGGYVDLYRVADNDDETAAGRIIPARTPVILYIEDDNEVPASSKAFAFEYTASDASLSPAIQEQIDEAIIFGKILQTPIKCDDDARYYKLGSKSGDAVSKMYWMYKEYGSGGTITHPNSDDGGYIRCSANKIYMRVQDSNAQNAFTMRLAGEATGIGEFVDNAEQEDTIYDIQGRKLVEITMPGMYIVNGKKVYVK